jgi:hypothetical protein
MPVLNVLTVLSLGLVAYDAMLHSVTLTVGRTDDGLPTIDLPWLLFPTFPTWHAYDLVWAAVHFVALAVLGAKVLSLSRR